MPYGPGHYDADSGVWIYGEDDIDALASDNLNRLALSTAAAVGGLRTDLDAMTDRTVGSSQYAVVMQSGWAWEGGLILRMGSIRMLSVVLKRTGAAISVPANGNIANSNMFAIANTSVDRPAMETPLGALAAGRVAAGSLLTTGMASLGSVSPGGEIAVNEQFSFGATWVTPLAI